MIADKPKSLSAEEIGEAKQKKGPLKKVTIGLKGGSSLDYIICGPDRKVKYAMISASQDGKLEKANELLINSCVLAGDMEAVRKDDSTLEALIEQINILQQEQKKVESVTSEEL